MAYKKKPRKEFTAKYDRRSTLDRYDMLEVKKIFAECVLEQIFLLEQGHYDDGSLFLTIEVKYKKP